MIQPDLLTKALAYQSDQLALLNLQLSIAKDQGESAETIQRMEATISSIERNQAALIPSLDLSKAQNGDWGQLNLPDVCLQSIVATGFYAQGNFRPGQVFFASWDFPADAHVKPGDHFSMTGGATVSLDQNELLIVRREFDPDELRAAVIAERTKSLWTSALKDLGNENEHHHGQKTLAQSGRFPQRNSLVVIITIIIASVAYWWSGNTSREGKHDNFQPQIWGSKSGSYLSHEELIESVEPAIVRLDVETASGNVFGSGFLIDESGVVITNCHVIDGAKSAKALFANDVVLKVIGVLAQDTNRDVAVLKIQTPKLKLATLKLRKARPKKGQAVIAFGAPDGLNFSVTQGIVSAIRTSDEKVVTEMRLQGEWIQTDAAISKGNSGGPLVDLSGQVVGMNTFGRIKGENLNFAISASDIAAVIEEVTEMTPTPLNATSLLIARLSGLWRAPSNGDVFRLTPQSDQLNFEVVSSRSIQNGSGTLTRRDDVWSGSISALFVSDPSRQLRTSSLKVVLLGRDEIDLIADAVTWDRNGRETSRQPMTVRLERQQ